MLTGYFPPAQTVLLRLFIILILAVAVFGGAYVAVDKLYLRPKLELQADKAAERLTPPGDPSLPEFQQCLEIQKTGTPAETLDALERFVRNNPTSPKRNEARDLIGLLNSAQFFGVKATDGNSVVVKQGDNISRIATRAKMPLELLVHFNKLQGPKIDIGQRLIAFPTNFRLVLNQKQQRVILMNGDKFFRQYPTLSWPGKKPLVPLAKQTAKVIAKVALTDKGVPPKPISQEYFGCFHTITYPISGHSIFSQADDPTRPVPGGIRLAPEHMSEIAVLLPKGAQVTLE